MTKTSSIRELENELFQEWRAIELAADPSATFITDGVVDEAMWMTSSPRIVFILKEANEKREKGLAKDWDLRRFLGLGAARGGATWNNIHRWSLAQDSELGERDPMMWRITPEVRRATLSRVAAMNLKKVPGKGDCNEKLLQERAGARRALIRRQLDLYRGHADLFVACGKPVSHFLTTDLQLGSGDTALEHVEGLGHLLHWRHPNARGERWKDLLHKWLGATGSIPGFR